MARARLLIAARIALIVILAAGATAGGYALTHTLRPAGTHAGRPVPPLPGVFRRATAAPPAPPHRPVGSAPSAAGVRRALARLLRDRALGRVLHGRIVDARTGAVLLDRTGAAPGAPASTAKLLTAAALLAVRPATDRIPTTVRAGVGGSVVLVGGGDPTLSGARPGSAPLYPDAARLSDLAAQLRARHVRPTRIVVDGSLFRGPPVSPSWAPEDVPSGYAAPITAVLADGGRAAPGAAQRSDRPDLAAGRELAVLLGRPGLPVVLGHAGVGGRVLARVASAPFATLIEQMLLASDNVIAECLARQVALAGHRPASFTGAARAVRSALAGLGVDPGAGLVDGSGLAARDRVSAVTLTGLLRLIARTPRLRAVVAALPVAGWSGTLAGRYGRGPQRAAAGLVRAKTGTLSDVATLAGFVHDRDGRLLVFALLADRVADPVAADAALDAVVTRLAACGCR